MGIICQKQGRNEKDEKKKEQLLDEILYYNEQDFDIVKEMFFDVNPVTETGVCSHIMR